MNSLAIRRGYVSVANIQIHYREAGDLSQPLLLLLHQAPSSSVMYELMMRELAEHFHLLAPDLPGFGQSDVLESGSDVGEWADVIAEFCNTFNKPVSGVFGHHTGAAVATEMLYRHPDMAERLMLSGPTLLSDNLKNTLPERVRAFPVSKDGLHLIGMWQRIFDKEEGAPLALVQREALLGLALGERYPDAYAAVIRHDYQRAISEVSQPVLMFAGTADPLYTMLDDAFACVQSGVKTEIVAAASWSCERHAVTVSALLRRFMGTDFPAQKKLEWPCES
ncbi:MAG: alpha/beta fold hydrolase [Spongiibacteraceae bacterium]